MSYILTASSSISTPVSIANGGTAAVTKEAAMTSLTNTLFSNSSQSANWGTVTVNAPSGVPDPMANQTAIIDLITALEGMGVIL